MTDRFRKRPVEVRAFRVTESIIWAGKETVPDWFVEAWNTGNIVLRRGSFLVRTLEGNMTTDYGNWVVMGIRRELYPVEDSIFRETYERVEEGGE